MMVADDAEKQYSEKVRVPALFFVKTYAQQRYGAGAEHFFSRGAKQDAMQVGAPPGPHDDQVGVLQFNDMD